MLLISSSPVTFSTVMLPKLMVLVFEHPVKHRLHHVLTRIGVVTYVVQKAEKFTMVSLKKEAYPAQIARFYPEHQRVISQ